MQHISYKDDEIADNDSSYFLMKMNNQLNNHHLNNSSIMMKVNDVRFFEFSNMNKEKFPFYCFENDDVSSIDDLNFNELKKCHSNTKKSSHKYLVVFYGNINEAQRLFLKHKEFTKWNEEKPRIEFEMEDSHYQMVNLYGTMLKVFNKEYQPEIKTTTE